MPRRRFTRHGFHYHEPGELIEAASAARFEGIAVVDLRGRVTEGDHVLRARRAELFPAG